MCILVSLKLLLGGYSVYIKLKLLIIRFKLLSTASLLTDYYINKNL